MEQHLLEMESSCNNTGWLRFVISQRLLYFENIELCYKVFASMSDE